MSIFINADSKIIVQGMTGSEGTKHTRRMLASGSKVVGGVTPGKGGQSVEIDGHNLPVFNTVGEAMAATGANVSVVFVPPKFAKAAVVDAIDAAMPLVVVITEGIPVHDSASFYAYSLTKGTTRIIGPNCPGLISPGKSNVGIIPANITGAGPIGLVSKSGTLTYQMMFELRDIGFSTAVGIGGDPVVGYVAGFTAPEGKTMGHAGAIVSGSSGTAQGKKDALEAAGVKVGQTPSETARLLRAIMGR
jgi:succinyl-CoA synthetase alpha subunit